MYRNQTPRRAFTLTQLIVLLAVLVILAGLLFGSVLRVREAAERTQSMGNLKHFVLATHNVADANQAKFPMAGEGWYPIPKQAEGNGYGSCLFHLLPYVEQNPIYKNSQTKVGNDSIYGGWKTAGRPVQTFQGPGDPTLDPTSDGCSYVANALALKAGARFASIQDGLSQTIFFAEGYARTTESFDPDDKSKTETVDRRFWQNPAWHPAPGPVMFQAAPPKEAASPYLPQALRRSGLNVGMGDGSVRLVSPSVTAATFYAACTPAENDILGTDW